MGKMLKTIVDTFGECEIYKKGVWMPLNDDYMNKNFDVKTPNKIKFEKDLDFGKMGEFWVDNLLSNGTIEVKTERDIWFTTGNIAIEIRGRNGRLSGISTTEATTWIHLLSLNGEIEGGFIFKVSDLKERIKELHESGQTKIVMGGDDNASQMVLLPIDKLFKD
jgi:hypothetical protein